jgi:hypothetical protein
MMRNILTPSTAVEDWFEERRLLNCTIFALDHVLVFGTVHGVPFGLWDEVRSRDLSSGPTSRLANVKY